MTKEKNYEKFTCFIKQAVKNGVLNDSCGASHFIEGKKWAIEAAGDNTSILYYTAILYYLCFNFRMALNYLSRGAGEHDPKKVAKEDAQKMLAFWLGHEDAEGKNPLPWILEGAGLQGNEDAKKLLADYTEFFQKEKNRWQLDDLLLPKNWHEDAQAQLNYFIDCFIKLVPESRLKLFKKQYAEFKAEFKKENG